MFINSINSDDTYVLADSVVDVDVRLSGGFAVHPTYQFDIGSLGRHNTTRWVALHATQQLREVLLQQKDAT